LWVWSACHVIVGVASMWLWVWSACLVIVVVGVGVVRMSEELSARFAHLLQPIRDLTKNWDIDVAAQLEEYLEEVGG